MSRTDEIISEHHEAPRESGYEKEYALLDRVLTDLSDAIIEEGSYVHKQQRRVFIQVNPEHLREVITYMQDTHDMWQFSTLSGRDLGDDLQAVYHFFLTDKKIGISFRVNVPRLNPEYPSITDIVPAAEFVENELRELFGIVPLGHPNVRRVELPENWPKDEHPMRKDWADPRGLMTRSKTIGAKPPEEL
ncbi:NADH-quinone oxidoreductase subunit C [Candidatus Thorarchaeota archaeon]|nr:MAG: NADH-quinone oxidoreductase subunit C [Candidatus Thorarchaeota archaeon]